MNDLTMRGFSNFRGTPRHSLAFFMTPPGEFPPPVRNIKLVGNHYDHFSLAGSRSLCSMS